MLVLFFPGAIGATPAHLTAAGLADLAADAAPNWLDFRGPDGARGMLCYWGDTLPAARADDYEWSDLSVARGPLPVATDHGPRTTGYHYQIGRLKGIGVPARSLARRQQQPGRELMLADGQVWTIPVARQLPRVLGLDEAGDWTGVIEPKYAAFWRDAWRMLEELAISDEGEARVSWGETIDFAARAMAINYRVNREIVSFLGLFRTDLIWPLIQLVTEFEEIAAALSQKKTADPPLDSPASSDGGAG